MCLLLCGLDLSSNVKPESEFILRRKFIPALKILYFQAKIFCKFEYILQKYEFIKLNMNTEAKICPFYIL